MIKWNNYANTISTSNNYNPDITKWIGSLKIVQTSKIVKINEIKKIYASTVYI